MPKQKNCTTNKWMQMDVLMDVFLDIDFVSIAPYRTFTRKQNHKSLKYSFWEDKAGDLRGTFTLDIFRHSEE